MVVLRWHTGCTIQKQPKIYIDILQFSLLEFDHLLIVSYNELRLLAGICNVYSANYLRHMITSIFESRNLDLNFE